MNENLNVPFMKLPENIKQWVRDNGYLIKETKTSSIVGSKWRDAYITAHPISKDLVTSESCIT